MRFVADSMLGKLARYLRILGYDTVYQESYSDQRLSELVEEGRVLLTRSNARLLKYPDSIFIDRDLVRDQLQAVDGKIGLNRDQGKWFTRCSVCNSVLSKPDRAAAPEHVPDFVSFSYPQQVRFCPYCRRFYWPGTHREKMLARLKSWGF
jgi:uncharacterized protein with PIN domain